METGILISLAWAVGLIMGAALSTYKTGGPEANNLKQEALLIAAPHFKELYDLLDAVSFANLELDKGQMERMYLTYLNKELGENVSLDTAKAIYNILILSDDPVARKRKFDTGYLRDNVVPTIKHIVKPFLEEKTRLQGG